MIAVVIATYNEAENIRTLLDQLKDYTVIVVDDSSPDNTGGIAGEYDNVRAYIREERGIASAYKFGFEKALELNPEYIIQMDAGLTHNPKDIPMMLSLARFYEYDLLIGSRFKDRKTSIKSYRTLISLTAAKLMSFIHIKESDVTSGFRCWNPELLGQIVEKIWISKGFAFQLETLYMANKISGKDKIYSMPISYRLTNSSFKPSMLLEAIGVYFVLFFS